MGKFIKLNTSDLKELRKVDPRLVSYNVEMTEVTGGTFWSAYTEAQVEGIEEVSMTLDLNDLGSLQQYYEPVDLYNERLRKLARELGTAWVRVSGTWA
ncbi:MAG: beta-glucuronidase, partial [Romboutsia sp.]|nr:beta-glucuronidase [Romboutsia sp.]